MNDLKPCPFCGCEVKFESTGWDYPLVRINHPESDCVIHEFMKWKRYAGTREERMKIIDGWNRRVNE